VRRAGANFGIGTLAVLFGAALGVFLLKEPILPARLAAALLIVCGLALIRLH
jgi:drug/metabolite transporter (DMT)-like permease